MDQNPAHSKAQMSRSGETCRVVNLLVSGLTCDSEGREAEPGGARLAVKEFALRCGKCPVLSEFVRMPILLHGASLKTPDS
jgi:hypothetical protein